MQKDLFEIDRPAAETVNKLSEKVHKANVDAGWWPENRCILTAIQLCVSEVSEATEGERKNLKDSHLPDLASGDVELADTAIRLLDLAGYFGWEYEPHGDDSVDFLFDQPNIFARHFTITISIATIGIVYMNNKCNDEAMRKDEDGNTMFSLALNLIIAAAESQGYDLWSSIARKLEYNKTRPDHTSKARAGEHGKKV